VIIPVSGLLAGLALAAQVPDAAATPEAAEALNRASEAACLRAAALDDARISAPTRYSDTLMVEARIIDGRPAGAAAERVTLLCLYHRGTGQAETRPFDPEQARGYSRELRDVWWHAVDIAGSPPIGPDLVTMMLGRDGRISGRSGCNIYSALYRLDGEALEVVWPMTGTRRDCRPVVMDQEVRFRQIVLQARSVRLLPDGALQLTDRDGAAVRFVRAEGQMRPAATPE
jgi:heat shock protein HslJ